jgi:hypothetical protein
MSLKHDLREARFICAEENTMALARACEYVCCSTLREAQALAVQLKIDASVEGRTAVHALSKMMVHLRTKDNA